MEHLNKKSSIYTKKGDRGSTTFANGNIVYKDNPRVCAYGKIDELNSHIGMLVSQLDDRDITSDLERIQNNLLSIGSSVAQSDIRIDHLPTETKHLESAIDYMDGVLPPLSNFILPGGTTLAAQSHIIRTVCRSAERSLAVLLNDEYAYMSGEADMIAIQYINRLSDYFFVLARFLNFREKREDVIWKKNE